MSTGTIGGARQERDIMPTYQYVCSECNEGLEVVQSFTDDAMTTCPACGKEGLKKVYGSVGVVFKGSGFYRNDSRSTSSSTSPATSSGAANASPAPATPAPNSPATPAS